MKFLIVVFIVRFIAMNIEKIGKEKSWLAHNSMVRVAALYAESYQFKSGWANKNKIVVWSNGNSEVSQASNAVSNPAAATKDDLEGLHWDRTG